MATQNADKSAHAGGDHPLVSVLMPVYNAQAYIEAALDSLKGQTFADFEVIVVDDGSTDQSAKLVAAAGEQDHRIRLNRLGRHLGVTAALNNGLRMARGRYIARLDADDLARPERLARQTARLNGDETLVGLGCAVTWMDADGLTIGDHPYPPEHAGVMQRLLAGRSGMPHTGVMLRGPAVRQVGGYREDFPVAQDFDLWLRLSQVGRLANLPESLVWQRKHRASLTGRRRREQLATRQRTVQQHPRMPVGSVGGVKQAFQSFFQPKIPGIEASILHRLWINVGGNHRPCAKLQAAQ